MIQNAIEHGGASRITISIKTFYDQDNNISTVIISDDGKGIDVKLLEKNADGVENIFIENISTKNNTAKDSGYGCFIAYQIAKRCGWDISVTNNTDGGATFTISIKNWLELEC